MNLRPTDYESVALPLSYTGNKRNLILQFPGLKPLSDSSESRAKLDPALRERLMKESRNPWRGFRRVIWIACLGSASIGFFVMSAKAIAGNKVLVSDAGIQIGALAIFSGLLWLDRSREN